jgi:superfamily II DNA or RNA helicase
MVIIVIVMYIEYIKDTIKKQTKELLYLLGNQSIILPKKWFTQFGMIIGDEAHLFKAVSLSKIMNKLEKCKYRVGLTGTLDGTKTHKLVLEGLFGTVNKVVSTSELQEKETTS